MGDGPGQCRSVATRVHQPPRKHPRRSARPTQTYARSPRSDGTPRAVDRLQPPLTYQDRLSVHGGIAVRKRRIGRSEPPGSCQASPPRSAHSSSLPDSTMPRSWRSLDEGAGPVPGGSTGRKASSVHGGPTTWQYIGDAIYSVWVNSGVQRKCFSSAGIQANTVSVLGIRPSLSVPGWAATTALIY